MKLTYIGPDFAGEVALPEGWPAESHDEPDDTLAKEKIASGNYEKATKALPRNAEILSEG